MSTENPRNKDRIRLCSPGRDENVEILVKDTERQIANTKLFLDRLQQGEDQTRRYVEEVRATFENDLRRFQRNRGENADK